MPRTRDVRPAPWAPATLAVRAGPGGDPATGAVAFPIFQTATFAQEEPGGNPPWCYARTGNPTRAALERALADLEGARHGFAFASGMAAATTLLLALEAGDRIVAGRDLYGGVYRILTKVFARFGVTVEFADTSDLAALGEALRKPAALLWLESPSNPLLRITDLRAAAALGRARGARVVVDNTFASPILQRPLECGADVVLHSTTKYLNGHGDVLGGALLCDDDGLAGEIRFLQNAAGAVPGPQDCFLLQRGLRTLALRVERHGENARRVAEFLAGREEVAAVHWPGLPGHPGHAVARRQMKGFGAMVSLELRGGEPATRRFLRGLRLFTLAESLGSVRSLVAHPATMTHAAVEPAVRRAAGIGDGLLRLSVGVEDAGDLVEDLRAGLEASRAPGEPSARSARRVPPAPGGDPRGAAAPRRGLPSPRRTPAPSPRPPRRRRRG
jgi:cystathionine gamma-lyase